MATHKFQNKLLATGANATLSSLVSATTCTASLASLVSLAKG